MIQRTQAARVIFAFAAAFIGAQSSTSLAAEPMPISPNAPQDKNTYYATELKCPKLNSGVLEFSMRTPAGALSKISVNYSDSVPTKVKMLFYPAGGGAVETIVDAPLDSIVHESIRESILKVRRRSDMLYETVCSGDVAAKTRYDAILVANRKFLSGSK